MEAKAKFLGHPVHQMVIVFPLGLLATAIIFDAISLIAKAPLWTHMAFYMIGAGIIGGIVAAVFGLIDFLAIPTNTRAKTIGALHGVSNAVVLILFVISWALRRPSPTDPGVLAYALSFVGAALSLVAAWLGGELVDRLGIGVTPGAHANAPSSLHSASVAPGAPPR